METICTYLPYAQTKFFSSLVIDYIKADERLQPFYKYAVTTEGIKQAIEARKLFPQRRDVLVQELQKQYSGLELASKLSSNIQSLIKANTFTVTTAHQPNIFTGPLYFIYKILHTIKLADELTKQLPEYNFVPVYYMGSEDADLDEIGSVTIDAVSYKWNTKQTGAVGRMKVDKEFLQLINDMSGQLGVHPYGNEITELFRKVYKPGKTIQQATLELVNSLFGAFGLVVLIPDNANLKKLFQPVLEKELKEQFSHKAVNETIAGLENHYKPQAGGRELNLFYLTEDKRERIELKNGKYEVLGLGLNFTEEEIFKELNEHPERFSANVILRGVFQETVLPNIAFIGGGGERAYWLELKRVFESVNTPYPVLILRNSFVLIEKKWKEMLADLDINDNEIFLPSFDLMNLLVSKRSTQPFSLNGELKKTEDLYDEITRLAAGVDITLHNHVTALKTKAVKRLQELEKKMLRAEKRKFETEQRKIQKIKEALFPGNNLQERAENMSLFYAKYGKSLIDILLSHSLSLEQQFAILHLPG